MKTSELTGVALDWAVAQAEGEDYCDHDGVDNIGNAFEATRYSTDWAQGGPIIERERIALRYDSNEQEWQATYPDEDGWIYGWGSTPLIAAMRCYVASKLGDEVEIPEELQ
jgi:hypothetical protein